jgi:P-type Cu+ transporter
VDVTFAKPGGYVLNRDLRRRGAISDIVFRQYVTVDGDHDSAQLLQDWSAKAIDGIRVELRGDAQTGAPVNNLKPYLSAAGHIIVASQGLYTIDHGHGEAFDASGLELWPMPGTSFGPDISFHHRFGAPGLYKVWGQFQTANGQIITADFVVQAE